MKEKIILHYNKMEQGRNLQFIRNTNRHPTSSARVAHQYLKDTTLNFLLDSQSSKVDNLEVIENLKEYYSAEELKWKGGY